ncbi:hypothetical protein, partial [Burkholderia glumae]|uniref:hypothetical protein n=1 Tax=Burkholderia glumae TaxID=337 RepID=UPI001E499285
MIIVVSSLSDRNRWRRAGRRPAVHRSERILGLAVMPGDGTDSLVRRNSGIYEVVRAFDSEH